MVKNISASSVRAFIEGLDDIEVLRVQYCYQIGSTFVRLGLMEDSIINAMAICDRVKVSTVLGDDAPKWERLKDKNEKLRSSTLGSLISILSKHTICEDDLKYLKWIKEKRDFFVHRLFHHGAWPGDLDADRCRAMIRKLGYLEIIFARACARIWHIFDRADLMVLHDLGDNGVIMMNLDLFDEGF